MDNIEAVANELNQLAPDLRGEELPKLLEDYLVSIAKTGSTLLPWAKLRTLFRLKLEAVIREFQEASPVDLVPKMPNVEPFRFEEMRQRIFEQLDSYTGIPFTVQRLCELITEPRRHYKRIDKFMRGLEKIMLVVTTIEPNPLPGESGGSFLMNGLGMEGSSSRMELGEGISRRLEDKEEEEESLESPAKRMRLSTEEEEEEAGPCDSGAATPLLRDDPGEDGGVMAGSSECSSPGVTAAAPAAPSSDTTDAAESAVAAESTGGAGEADNTDPVDSTPAQATTSSTPGEDEEQEDNMDIDTECSSSQAKLECGASGTEQPEATAAAASTDGVSSVVEEEQEGVTHSQKEEEESKPEEESKVMEEEEVDGAAPSRSSVDVECGNEEEGVSTSVGSSSAHQPAEDVESNSEAEAREEEKQVEEEEEEMEQEQQEGNVESSSGEAAAISRGCSDEVGGMADSSADQPTAATDTAAVVGEVAEVITADTAQSDSSSSSSASQSSEVPPPEVDEAPSADDGGESVALPDQSD